MAPEANEVGPSKDWLYGRYGALVFFFAPRYAHRRHQRNMRWYDDRMAVLTAELVVQTEALRMRYDMEP